MLDKSLQFSKIAKYFMREYAVTKSIVWNLTRRTPQAYLTHLVRSSGRIFKSAWITSKQWRTTVPADHARDEGASAGRGPIELHGQGVHGLLKCFSRGSGLTMQWLVADDLSLVVGAGTRRWPRGTRDYVLQGEWGMWNLNYSYTTQQRNVCTLHGV